MNVGFSFPGTLQIFTFLNFILVTFILLTFFAIFQLSLVEILTFDSYWIETLRLVKTIFIETVEYANVNQKWYRKISPHCTWSFVKVFKRFLKIHYLNKSVYRSLKENWDLKKCNFLEFKMKHCICFQEIITMGEMII